MYRKSMKFLSLSALFLTAFVCASCNMMEDDRSDCPTGLYVQFKYDYNLQRADMFNDHVGEVTLYVFNEDGQLVMTQTESNTNNDALKDPNYRMNITGLDPGKYRLVALAGQNDYETQLATNRAKFIRSDMANGDDISSLDVTLEHPYTRASNVTYSVDNNGLPLDTLWHAISDTLVEVYYDTKIATTTMSLVRDTKTIGISLRELDDPTTMDVADYSMTITDHNSHILYDNSLDETDCVVYTPYATWNTYDRVNEDGSTTGVGVTAHAEFMTSRLLYHEEAADDAILSIVSNDTGDEVVRVNVPDLLSQLSNYDASARYTKQQFLDRGYDYQIDFFLKGSELQYANISISVLAWSIRVQFGPLS